MKCTKKFRRVLTVAAVAAMLVTTAAAASNVTKKMIEANYSGIKLVVDGVEVTPKDSNGNAVDPFISEGTTYLPVRAVGEALGKEVTWDGATKTVYIGEVPGAEENWMTKLPPYQLNHVVKYDGSDLKASFEVAGAKQTLGLVVEDVHGWDKPQVIWNTNGQYKTMSVTVGHMEDGTHDAKIEVYLDGVYTTVYELKYDAAPKSFNIDLKYSPNVKLVFVGADDGGLHDSWGLYDISFS